jgi:hypothetical protein
MLARRHARRGFLRWGACFGSGSICAAKPHVHLLKPLHAPALRLHCRAQRGGGRGLKNLPGSWSDLGLACLIHVGMKRLTPDQDSGLGIEAEYQEAVRLHEASMA